MTESVPVLRREAKDSSGIENIVTTQGRLYRALAASSSVAVDASTKEVMQYWSALRVGEALVHDHGFLSVNHIMRILMPFTGCCRTSPSSPTARRPVSPTWLSSVISDVRMALPRISAKELVEGLFVHPYSKIEFLVNAPGVERKAASRYLQSLEELGLLASQKVGRERISVDVRLMTVLSRETVT